MPIYAYRCDSCGYAQDVLQKISDPLLTVCPACGVASFSKQITAAGFQLKGTGWYVTDFKGGAAKPAPSPAAAAPVESKPAADGASAPAASPAPAESSASAAPAGAAPSTGSGGGTDVKH